MSTARQVIKTRVGQQFDVALPTYLCASWNVTLSTGNVKLIGKGRIGALPPQRAKDGQRYVGRFAPTIFTFEGVKPGRCTITAKAYQLASPRAMATETVSVAIAAPAGVRGKG